MKKLTKILASVLTLSMAMSTVVMPMSVKAEDAYGTKYVWKTFSDAADVADITGVAIAEGFGGKDASDGVGYVTAHTGWKSGTWSDEILTAEVQVYADNNKIEMYSGTAIDGKDRPGVYIQNGKIGYVKANGWTYTEVTDVEKNMWHTMAIEMNRITGMTKIYLDGEVVISGTNLFAHGSAHSTDWRIQGNGHIDNWFIYTVAYSDVNTKPKEITGANLSFVEGDTVADAKAAILAAQDPSVQGKVVAHVYKDKLFGTEAEDTEILGSGWHVVVTSKGGNLYEKSYTVESVVVIEEAKFVDGTTVAVTIQNKKAIDSMMMVLVQDNGAYVKASEVKKNIAANAGGTFVIEGIEGTLSNPEVFFVKSWDELAPMLDSITPIN